MKKWIIATVIILILTIVSVYIFIPGRIVISKLVTAKVTLDGAVRYLSSENNWERWWMDEQGKTHEKGKPFVFNGALYRLSTYQNKAVGIEISDQGSNINSVISLVSLNKDSTLALWQCEIPGSNNPFLKMSGYRQAVAIKENMNAVMKNFLRFISKPENIYGFTFRRESTNDTLLLSARFNTKHYPTTVDIYQYLSQVEANIKKQKATIAGFPLLHIGRPGDGSYEVQVAWPTSKWLKNDGIFFSRRMVKGYFIVADVTGGFGTVSSALDQLENYTNDYGKTRMAIPFQRLVTDRMKQTDTSKWYTQIYMPVIE